jgi:hypothetical protein
MSTPTFSAIIAPKGRSTALHAAEKSDDLLQPQTSALRRSRIKRRQAGMMIILSPHRLIVRDVREHASWHLISRRILDAQVHVLRGYFVEPALLSASWYFPFTAFEKWWPNLDSLQLQHRGSLLRTPSILTTKSTHPSHSAALKIHLPMSGHGSGKL